MEKIFLAIIHPQIFIFFPEKNRKLSENFKELYIFLTNSVLMIPWMREKFAERRRKATTETNKEKTNKRFFFFSILNLQKLN